ncbi:MAG TPA: hypothetical protein VFP52_08650 [Myxococcales bacterium]|nr:hypothetical protein [Myxococcales bacterium]HET9753018.1 hypothetical protein [Myxococcales bacterium]
MLQSCCGILFVAAVLAASHRFPAIDLLRFPLAWIGVLVALDGLARWRRGHSPLRSPADLLAAAAASVVFWDVFELVNLRLRNWWYAGVSPSPLAGGIFAAVSFATVLPAVRLGLAQLEGAAPRAAGHRRLKAGAAAGMLLVALALPRYAFPLAWIFLWPLCEALAGVRVPLRVMALGLPLGLLWESLNWRCARGWFYTVPFFDRPKLFEMPLPGYLGYLPFALEAAGALAVLDRARPHLKGGKGALALCAVALLHVLSEHLTRGQTVVSFSR